MTSMKTILQHLKPKTQEPKSAKATHTSPNTSSFSSPNNETTEPQLTNPEPNRRLLSAKNHIAIYTQSGIFTPHDLDTLSPTTLMNHYRTWKSKNPFAATQLTKFIKQSEDTTLDNINLKSLLGLDISVRLGFQVCGLTDEKVGEWSRLKVSCFVQDCRENVVPVTDGGLGGLVERWGVGSRNWGGGKRIF